MMTDYIFGIDCQTTLQLQEKLISRLAIESYVQLRCSCCGRILGQLSGYWATYCIFPGAPNDRMFPNTPEVSEMVFSVL